VLAEDVTDEELKEHFNYMDKDKDGGVDADEDAYDMRKALSHDKQKKSTIPLDRPVHIEELEY